MKSHQKYLLTNTYFNGLFTMVRSIREKLNETRKDEITFVCVFVVVN